MSAVGIFWLLLFFLVSPFFIPGLGNLFDSMFNNFSKRFQIKLKSQNVHVIYPLGVTQGVKQFTVCPVFPRSRGESLEVITDLLLQEPSVFIPIVHLHSFSISQLSNSSLVLITVISVSHLCHSALWPFLSCGPFPTPTPL